MQPADVRLGDWNDRRFCYGNVYQQPIFPWSYAPGAAPAPAVVTDVRLGDALDRRRMYGNIYTQPIVPWVSYPQEMRVGDFWDRRRTFGNLYTQRFAPPLPTGTGLGYYYGDAAVVRKEF